MININRSELNETVRDITAGVILGMATGIQVSPELAVILSGVFPWSVGISFSVDVLGIYIGSLSSFERLEVTSRILKEL